MLGGWGWLGSRGMPPLRNHLLKWCNLAHSECSKTVLSKAPTFTNTLWECLTVHQISPSNQFVMLPADHSCFQEKLSKWAVYGQLYNMSHVMRKDVNKKAQTSLHIHTVWSYLGNFIMEILWKVLANLYVCYTTKLDNLAILWSWASWPAWFQTAFFVSRHILMPL